MVDYLLIHSSQDGYFDPDYISFHQFDMPAVRVLIDKSFYIVFPYLKYLPVEQILDELTNETALLISSSIIFSGQRWDIPEERKAVDSISEKISLSIASDGKITVKDIKSFHGTSAYVNRSQFADMKPEEKEKALMKKFTSPDLKLSDFKYELKNIAELERDFIVELSYSLDNQVTITPDDILFQTGGLLSPVNLYSQKIDTTERVNPIDIRHPEIFVKDVSISYPPEWKLQTAMNDTTVSNKFGSSVEKKSATTGVINISQVTKLEKSKGAKNEASLLYDIIRGDQRRNLPVIVFSAGK